MRSLSCIAVWWILLPCAAFEMRQRRIFHTRLTPVLRSPLHLMTQEHSNRSRITSTSSRASNFKRIRSFLRRPLQSLSPSSTQKRKNSLHVGALFLATLLFRPLKAFAGGASFGGSKGSAAVPLQKYVLQQILCVFLHLSFYKLTRAHI